MVRWLPGDDALRAPFASLGDTARLLGRFVRELQEIDTAEVPTPGTDGFMRGLPLAGRDEGFESSLAQCDGLLDVARVTEIWADALAAPEWRGPPVWLHADLLPGNLLVRDGSAGRRARLRRDGDR